MHRIRSRSIVTAGLMLALISGSVNGASPAAADAATGSDQQDVVTQLLEVAYSTEIGVRAGKHDVLTSELTAVGRLVDDAGKLLQPAFSRSVALDAGAESGLACVKKGRSARGFTAHAPVDTFRQSKHGLVRGLFHLYSKQKARTVGRYKTLQYEMCGVGGADLANGFKAYRAGVGVAYKDPTNTSLIGWKWQSGSTPKNYSLDLGFELGTEKSPLAISSSLSQQAHEQLTGSFVPPVGGTGLEPFARNAALAWWEDGCETRTGPCLRNEGSGAFQGAIAHGLWEFPQTTAKQTRWFRVASFFKQQCDRWYGLSCG